MEAMPSETASVTAVKPKISTKKKAAAPPIMTEVYQLFPCLLALLEQAPKTYKYSIGEMMRESAIKIGVLTMRANCAYNNLPKREEYILAALDEYDVFAYMVRVVEETTSVKGKPLSNLVIHMVSFKNQAVGWARSTKQEIEKQQNEV